MRTDLSLEGVSRQAAKILPMCPFNSCNGISSMLKIFVRNTGVELWHFPSIWWKFHLVANPVGDNCVDADDVREGLGCGWKT